MSDFQFDPKKLEEMKAASNDALKQLKESVIAMGDNPVDNSAPSQELINRVMNYMQTIESRMGYLHDTVMNHMADGHLPPIKSQAQMSNAIKALKLDDEYTVQKKTLYAAVQDGYIKVGGKKIN